MVYVTQSQIWCRKLTTFDSFFHIREEGSTFAIIKCATVHNFCVLFLGVSAVSNNGMSAASVFFTHFASVQFHFVFKAFHLCDQIHQSHCSVPSWGCILNSYYLHHYV